MMFLKNNIFKKGEPHKEEIRDKKRRHGTVRGDWKEKFAVVKSKLGKYMVSVFIQEHNHPLVTTKSVHLLRSHRSIYEVKKSLTYQFSTSNAPTHQ